ncbi:MAG: peptide-methionine (R)-S-oxide reductase MsrB [Spongiibacter sp.]|uniref:Peptide methionine sulfoxide reductase MsrB n=1 Tax=Spongiibacter thalassae TaxID=2721624 RepID=A0ABX1GEE6_9GAMM|nr:peptide-methionine (R)-S-oxide reductase MsrB [Spongiibacter thalassae]NKI17296.1 peptide-methionine (R)-S-oxide reductase MsrB [Spongiibacter thalassae]
MEKVVKTADEWRELLGADAYHVCREKGTERAFTGEYYNEHSPGKYLCRCCGEVLFDAATKYDSGSGWPSFYQPVAEEVVAVNRDTSHGMVREEVVCARCDAHLGHVFPDGPAPTGLRYCINSLSLSLDKDED